MHNNAHNSITSELLEALLNKSDGQGQEEDQSEYQK